MEATYNTTHGIMECYKNCLVFHLTDDGITAESAKKIMGYAYTHYEKRPFVFISNRKFASNIHPEAYDAINPKLIIGLAIVSEDEAVKEEATNEMDLFEGSFSFFATLEAAIGWADTVVREY